MIEAFAPYILAGVPLRNRFVRSATVSPYATDGMTGDAGMEYYRLLAKNQVGLIVTEMTYVSPDGQASQTQAGLCNDAAIDQHKKITEAVHREGGKIFIQLNHGGAASLGKEPLSPSGIPSPYTGHPAKVMIDEDIAAVIRDFSSAAVRAKASGYDGVQIHCAHGYLLSQFISPFYNRRTDKYGGTPENRFRFPAEVISAVLRAVGPAYPVCIKINSNSECDDDLYGEALMWMGKECASLGICAMEVSGYDFTPRGRAGEHTYYLERAAKLRAHSGLPVMLVGGIRTTVDVQWALDAGIDLVSMSRPFLCQPDIVLRLRRGERSQCQSCSQCFVMLRKFETEGRLCILHKQGSDRNR